MVCDDLGMTDYIIHAEHRALDPFVMKHKEKADLLEGKSSVVEMGCNISYLYIQEITEQY